jgi:membrane associated rhomboid family serine protease
VLTSAYSHGSVLHIAFNCWGLWSYGTMEAYLGTLAYLRFTFILLVGSECLMMAATWLLWRFAARERERNTYTLGYSGVVFGWMAAAALLIPTPFPLFGFDIPAWLMPFIFLGVTQLFIRNASFLGHLAGILIGFTIALGWFDWVEDYLCLCGVIWSEPARQKRR